MAHFVKLENEKENQNENKENNNNYINNEQEDLQECMICFYDVDTDKTFIGCDTCGNNVMQNVMLIGFCRKMKDKNVVFLVNNQLLFIVKQKLV